MSPRPTIGLKLTVGTRRQRRSSSAFNAAQVTPSRRYRSLRFLSHFVPILCPCKAVTRAGGPRSHAQNREPGQRFFSWISIAGTRGGSPIWPIIVHAPEARFGGIHVPNLAYSSSRDRMSSIRPVAGACLRSPQDRHSVPRPNRFPQFGHLNQKSR